MFMAYLLNSMNGIALTKKKIRMPSASRVTMTVTANDRATPRMFKPTKTI